MTTIYNFLHYRIDIAHFAQFQYLEHYVLLIRLHQVVNHHSINDLDHQQVYLQLLQILQVITTHKT
jgi:hypothetical protein